MYRIMLLISCAWCWDTAKKLTHLYDFSQIKSWFHKDCRSMHMRFVFLGKWSWPYPLNLLESLGSIIINLEIINVVFLLLGTANSLTLFIIQIMGRFQNMIKNLLFNLSHQSPSTIPNNWYSKYSVILTCIKLSISSLWC